MLAHAMSCLPETYKDQVISLQQTNSMVEEASRKSTWDVFYEFLKTKKASLEKFGGHVIDDILSSKGKSKNVNNRNHSSGSGGGQRDSGLEKMWNRWGPCPSCKKKGHWYKDRNGRKLASSRLYDCPDWRSKTPNERITVLAQAGGCVTCTGWTHKKDTCKAENKTCGVQNNGHTCQDSHHKLLHGVQHAYLNHMVAVNCMLSDQPVLLPIQKVSLSDDIETTIFMTAVQMPVLSLTH